MATEKSASDRLFIIFEVLAFVAIALVSKKLLDPIIWRFAGPVTLIGTLLLMTAYFRFRDLRWSEMGLRPLPGLKAKLLVFPQALLTFVAFAAAVAIPLLGGEALGLEFMTEEPEGVEARWGDIEGNLGNYLLWMGIVWTSAAFGEEMFFRGYLISRLMTALEGVRFGAVLAVLLPALLFGFGHMYYQGLRGLIITGSIAVAFGAMFLLFKRSLWPIILIHGLVDSLGMTARYLNLDI